MREPFLQWSRSSFPYFTSKKQDYSVLPGISTGYPQLKGTSPTCYSPVRHSRKRASSLLAVRLACLRRAASVRSEPGSNSPWLFLKPEGLRFQHHKSSILLLFLIKNCWQFFAYFYFQFKLLRFSFLFSRQAFCYCLTTGTNLYISSFFPSLICQTSFLLPLHCVVRRW